MGKDTRFQVSGKRSSQSWDWLAQFVLGSSIGFDGQCTIDYAGQ